jgi:hypothetical protein|tara:strand:- start:1501 stop:1731 length:231 start_codon:yes stop_codon:yes gene_type:complete
MNNDEDLDTRFSTHEAVCAERWKTVFHRLEDIEARAAERFDGVEESVYRLETILISTAGAGLIGAAGVIWAFISMS